MKHLLYFLPVVVGGGVGGGVFKVISGIKPLFIYNFKAKT